MNDNINLSIKNLKSGISELMAKYPAKQHAKIAICSEPLMNDHLDSHWQTFQTLIWINNSLDGSDTYSFLIFTTLV